MLLLSAFYAGEACAEHELGLRMREQMLVRYGGIAEPEKQICLTANGKPVLQNGECGFSVSHSGGMIVCCVNTGEKRPVFSGAALPGEWSLTVWGSGKNSAIGADVQLIPAKENRARIERIARRRFSPAENERLTSAGTAYAEVFFQMWTAKESFCKFTGNGLADIAVLDTCAVPDGIGLYSRVLESVGGRYAVSVCYTRG